MARLEQSSDARALVAEEHSPVLGSVLDSFAPGCRLTVLDLGPALGPSVGFFSRYRCQFWIADLYRTLLDRTPDPAEPRTFAQLPTAVGPFEPFASRTFSTVPRLLAMKSIPIAPGLPRPTSTVRLRIPCRNARFPPPW